MMSRAFVLVALTAVAAHGLHVKDGPMETIGNAAGTVGSGVDTVTGPVTKPAGDIGGAWRVNCVELRREPDHPVLRRLHSARSRPNGRGRLELGLWKDAHPKDPHVGCDDDGVRADA